MMSLWRLTDITGVLWRCSRCEGFPEGPTAYAYDIYVCMIGYGEIC